MIRRQVQSVIDGGLPVLIRKIRIVMALIFGSILGAFPLLIIRCLRPVVVIRFGQLISHRIGPYVAEPEVYLSEIEVGMHRGSFIDVFYHEPFISNSQVKKMWDRKLRVIQLARPVGRLNGWIPGGQIHQVPWREYQQRDNFGTLTQTKPHLVFTEEENLIGRSALLKMGVPENAEFVCFHARDSSYGESISAGLDIGRVDYRNSDINTYLPAMQKLTELGYYALRMGAVVDEPLVVDNPMIIDYAREWRDEFLDLYLASSCRFFVGSAVGITYLPMAFRRPTVHTNFIPIGVLVAWQPHDLCIPKKLWLKQESRYMNLQEVMESGVAMYARSYQYLEHGIELVDSTSEEITEVVLEMEKRLESTWIDHPEDQSNQEQFWCWFDKSDVNRAPQAKIGANYLRQNDWFIRGNNVCVATI